MALGNNEFQPMTRRHFDLKKKVLLRDSKIADKLIKAWDIEKNEKKLLSIFLKEHKNLSSQRYWELMRSIWVICGNLSNVHTFKVLMHSTRPYKALFSTPEESKELREMPNYFKVYRATNNINDGGISWTISKKYTHEYKLKYNKRIVIEKTIFKNDVFAYINRNNEFEIILL